MKLKIERKVLILIILGIIFTISLPNTNILKIKLDNNKLNASSVSGKIHIIGNTGWVNLKNAGNITGQGTFIDPYVIEDLDLDMGGSGNGIWVENSNVYFKIENCTFYNSANNWEDSAIKLASVKNAIINNSEFTNNAWGVFLDNSENNTVVGNTFKGTLGINLEYSNNNTIYLNNLKTSIMNVFTLTSTSNNNLWNSPEELKYNYENKTCFNYLGNFWNDHYRNDADGDGIGDTPIIFYDTERVTVDFYPLKKTTKNYEIKTNRNPIVTLIFPNNNETISASPLVQWTASDPDNDDLNFSLAYNRENTGWHHIASGINDTIYLWDIKNISDSDSIQLRVTVHDGFGGISTDYNDFLFTIAHPPNGSMAINQNDIFTINTHVSLNLSSSLATEMRFSFDESTWSSWEQYYILKELDVPATDGVKNVYVQFKSNFSVINGESIYDSIILDTTPPTGTILINNGDTHTSSTNVTLNINGMDVNGISKMRFSNDGLNWSVWENFSNSINYTLPTGNGAKTIYVQFMDSAGLTSTSVISDEITIEESGSTIPGYTLSFLIGMISITSIILMKKIKESLK